MSPADHCYAGAEDVACDFCTGRKLRALKFCLVCLFFLARYYEKNLQPCNDEATHSSSIHIHPLRHFEEVTTAVLELREKPQDILTDKRTNISQTETKVLLPQPEPKTRADFLKYA